MDKLLETNLFIGSASDAAMETRLRSNKIDCVVNVASEVPNPVFRGIESYKIGLEDLGGNSSYQFIIAVNTVITLLAENKRVLLHCREGVSRTPAVAVIYVMLSEYARNSELGYQQLFDRSFNKILGVRPVCASMLTIHKPLIKEAFESLKQFYSPPRKETTRISAEELVKRLTNVKS